MTTTISLLLIPLLLVSPQELYALTTQARLAQALAAATLGPVNISTTRYAYTYDSRGNLRTSGVPAALSDGCKAMYEWSRSHPVSAVPASGCLDD